MYTKEEIEKDEDKEIFRKAMTFTLEDCLCNASMYDPNYHDCYFFVRDNPEGKGVEFVNKNYNYGYEQIEVINKDDNIALLMHINKEMVFSNNKFLSEEDKEDINRRLRERAEKILFNLREIYKSNKQRCKN